jgi:GATA-binding protein
MRQSSSGSNSSVNGRHAEPSPNTEELRQAKTRISELEFVNDLFKGRVDQLEADIHRAEILQRESDTQLRFVYEQSQARENTLKREIEDLKREISNLKDTQPPNKRQRLSDDSLAPVRSPHSSS